MGVFFLDTSTLVKRYDQLEPGADKVVELCDPSLGHSLFVSTLAAVEVASALARKMRERRFSEGERDNHWVAFLKDYRDQYRIVAWDDGIRETAKRLIFAYPLRGYDAVQLASALRVVQFLAGFAPEVAFCTADRNQARAAASEGLPVELIAAV